MKLKKHFLMIALSVIVLVTLAVVGIAYGQDADNPNPENLSAGGNGVQSSEAIDALPGGTISYQGRLLQGGVPMNATLNITFRLYTASSGGVAFWTETQSVTVTNGLFSVDLGSVTPLDDYAVTFQSQAWLGIQPAGAASELAPRQRLGAVGYAYNIMPGTTLVDTNAAGGYIYSFYVSSANHPGIYGDSDTGNGIVGNSYAPSFSGVTGTNTSGGSTSHGVEGVAGGTGNSCLVGAPDCTSGVYSTGSSEAYGMMSNSGRSALLANTTTSFYTGWFYTTLTPNGSGIWTNGESSFSDYVTFGGGKSGYVVDIAYNDGTEPLEKGDVVVISGYDTAVVGDIPVIKVQKATSTTASGVVGIVDVLYVPCDTSQPLEAGQACGGFETDVTTVQPGQYLSVVTLGAYMGVKASAVNGAIKPGDLLSVDATLNGVAAKAQTTSVNGVEFVLPGTSFGKALGSLDSGTGLIPVFVTIR